MDLASKKEEVAYFMRRLYERRLTTSLGGNVSLKVNQDLVLITPSGIDKGGIQKEQIGEIRIDGTNLTPNLKLSIETPMHLAIYATRPDAIAVIHAHPVAASTFAASNFKINCRLLAESRLLLKEIQTAPYACMGTSKLAESVTQSLSAGGSAVLLANHGALTIGETLLQAFDRMEVLESAAKITILGKILGSQTELTRYQLSEIDNFFD